MESLLLTTPLTTLADNTQRPACPMVKIEPERLADLNIPRSGHSIFRTANNEWVVAGGHTAGFVPTPTAEYYADGRWHLINTVYTHDAGTAIPLRSGEVLLAGGFEKHLGIGQTFTAEMYDPSQHAFNGFGCLYKKRAITGGIQLGDGRVIITGNWYHDDGIECYDGHSQFSYIKDVTVSRSKPYIFRLAPNDVLILGNRGIHDEPVSSAVVDRLQGDPLHVPLLEAWQPMHFDTGFQRDDCFIGDEEKEMEGFRYAKLPEFRNKDPQYLSFAAVTGLQLVRWRKTQVYCGACGTKLEPSTWERAYVCPKCGQINYPRLNPAVIVAVTHNDKILVTTYSDRPSKGMACIAGFAEIGETIEECVHREVFEETGLKVKNLRFYKRQPWSFTDTLLFGFYCDLDGDDETVHVDPTELKEGHWLRRDEIPNRSGEASLTAEMQEMFRLGKELR